MGRDSRDFGAAGEEAVEIEVAIGSLFFLASRLCSLHLTVADRLLKTYPGRMIRNTAAGIAASSVMKGARSIAVSRCSPAYSFSIGLLTFCLRDCRSELPARARAGLRKDSH